MKQLLERILPQRWVDAYKDVKNRRGPKVRQRWEASGKPVPPPHAIKQQAIQQYQRRSGYEVLVETGTYKGDMIFAQRNHFKKIYSIELSDMLFQRARRRFARFPHVTLLQGNSGEVISKVVVELTKPAIFWLDGHYSGGVTAKIEKYSPIIEELHTLAAHNQLRHIFLIDDARGFVGAHGYPTIAEMQQLTATHFPGYTMQVDEDIIRMVPSEFS